MNCQYKVVQLENGNIFAFYEKDSELTILPNGDYFCTTNHNYCFERPSHSLIIKNLKPKGSNITMQKHFKQI